MDILGFEIDGPGSCYATDPSHAPRIRWMSQFISDHLPGSPAPKDIDMFMQLRAHTTPLTGQMFLDSVSAHNLGRNGLCVMMALIQNDSMYGTLGKGARLFNPGNVGDDDLGRERNYGTWEAGVDAVAAWLARHRTVYDG